jgi:hypothetical protein
MNNGMVFHDTLRAEVLVDDKTQGDDNCVLSQAADANNELTIYETSRRKDHEEAMTGKTFHDTSTCIVNEEILVDVGKNGDKDCVVPQDNDRNNELMPYDTTRREETEEMMVDKVFHYWKTEPSNTVLDEVSLITVTESSVEVISPTKSISEHLSQNVELTSTEIRSSKQNI